MTRTSAFVLGYHGCDKEIGEKVLAGKARLLQSENEYDWVGTGVYFWENSARRARDWAEFAKGNPQFIQAKIAEPFVVGAIINLGLCLDLLEAESIAVVADGYEGLRESYEAAGVPMLKNETFGGELVGRRLDCAVINYVHETRERQGEPAFDSVRAPFIEGPPLYEGGGFHARTHVQICVRNPAQIMGYFRPMGLV